MEKVLVNQFMKVSLFFEYYLYDLVKNWLNIKINISITAVI